MEFRDFGFTGMFSGNMVNLHHNSSICKSNYFHMRNIGSIRSILSNDTCAQFIHYLFTVRLDYCNSILYIVCLITVCIVYRTFTTLLYRILARLPRFSHISATLFDLQWLPIRYKITFKLCILTYQAYHRTAPSYLCDLIVPYVNTR